MKIAIIGTGTVGQTFAAKLITLGHEVMMGTRNVSEKLASNSTIRTQSYTRFVSGKAFGFLKQKPDLNHS